MSRFYLAPEAWPDHPALTGDEARHLAQVLRAKPGDSVTVFDGKGRRANAELLTVSRDRVSLRLGEIVDSGPPRPAITLAQAIPKGKTMDLIVQKAVELGVSAIQPLVTRNTVVRPGEGKSDKWRRVALEACKQCGQDWLPEIADPLTIESWLGAAEGDLKIIASLVRGTRSFRDVLRSVSHATAVTLLIGPEGDFTSEETAAAIASGFRPVSLGTNVLRSETAALFALVAVRYEFGDCGSHDTPVVGQ